YNGGTVDAVDLALVRASLGSILTGIRAATAEGWPDLSPLCQATGVSTGTVGLFKPCAADEDCESNHCIRGPSCPSLKAPLRAQPACNVCEAKTCTASSDCASGLCAFGSDGLGGTRGVCLSGTADPLASADHPAPAPLGAACASGNDCLSGRCLIG